MAVTSWEIPDISGSEVDDLPLSHRVDGGDTAIAFEHIGPFGGVGVPMQLAKGARLERHVDAGELFRNRKAGDVRFLGGATVELLRLLRAERITKRWELRFVERCGRRTVGRLLRLGRKRGGVPKETPHRDTSKHSAPGDLNHGKFP